MFFLFDGLSIYTNYVTTQFCGTMRMISMLAIITMHQVDRMN